jgi:dihydrofolate reductase
MRKLILSNMLTVDGFFAGPQREIDWHVVDDEFNQNSIALLDAVDTLIFGRVTYQLMASYWPTTEALNDDPQVAERMNRMPKITFSRSLDHVDWEYTRLIKNDPVAEISQLKSGPGKDMVIFGSGSLASILAGAGLIDDYRIFISPIILGSGMPLFAGLQKRVQLELVGAKIFKSGVVGLRYTAG